MSTLAHKMMFAHHTRGSSGSGGGLKGGNTFEDEGHGGPLLNQTLETVEEGARQGGYHQPSKTQKSEET